MDGQPLTNANLDSALAGDFLPDDDDDLTDDDLDDDDLDDDDTDQDGSDDGDIMAALGTVLD